MSEEDSCSGEFSLTLGADVSEVAVFLMTFSVVEKAGSAVSFKVAVGESAAVPFGLAESGLNGMQSLVVGLFSRAIVAMPEKCSGSGEFSVTVGAGVGEVTVLGVTLFVAKVTYCETSGKVAVGKWTGV